MNRRPDILVIVCDQLRYDCIGKSGEYPVITPNIDRLAEKGMWFDNAYTPTPLCCPARQAMLTGRRPESFGCLWNYDNGLKTHALEPDDDIWTKKLGGKGYKSAYIGKWHVNPDKDPIHFGFGNYVSEKDYSDFRKNRYPGEVFSPGWFGGIDPAATEDTRTGFFARKASDYIREFSAGDNPWHIRVDFPEPHLPCTPTEEFFGMYEGKPIPEWKNFNDNLIDKPYIQKQQLLNWGVENYSWSDWKETVRRYYSVITQTDFFIGKIIDEAKSSGRNPLIIFTSDHGDMCGAHKMADKHYVLYEDVVKVPLIAVWPGVIEPQSICSRYVYNFLDIPCTLLEILEEEIPAGIPGRSLMPVFRGENISQWRDHVVSTYNGQQFGLYTQRMIKYGNWKYIWNTTDTDELYNLGDDPGELNNVIRDNKNEDILSYLRKKLLDTLEKEGDGLVTGPWLREQLKSGRKI